MYPQMLLIPAMMITTYCHTPKNNSDVIVTYSGHAEAINPAPILVPTTTKPEPTQTVSVSEYKKQYENYSQLPTKTETTPNFGVATESVVFIPNDPQRDRVEDYLENYTDDDKISIKTIMRGGGGRSIKDILNDKKIRVETEPPSKDILFVSGKNNEEVESITQKKKEPSGRRRSKMAEKKSTTQLDCSNLDCNITLKSVCAGKMEHKRWRYRLFLNDCFFRKVNCNFKYNENRFTVFPLDTCKNVAGHYSERPFVYKPLRTVLPEYKPSSLINYRRSSSSRRSLNINVDGQFCSHPCPSSCPDQYEPECAVSNRGLRRVFVNHCKLDHNSCSYGAVHARCIAQLAWLQECCPGRAIPKKLAYVFARYHDGIIVSRIVQTI